MADPSFVLSAGRVVVATFGASAAATGTATVLLGIGGMLLLGFVGYGIMNVLMADDAVVANVKTATLSDLMNEVIDQTDKQRKA
ncbi:MAG: hypothetical protein JNN12_11930 [Bacteroidetes Order II. Incertae sedis bacterium]|nr:hypothetical protein [Bacteroidetes Order II. bacterium]